MGIFKNKISIENKGVLDEYIRASDCATSGISFTSLYMWRNVSDISWDIVGDYLCIAALDVSESGKEYPLLYPPLTKDGSYDCEKLRDTLHAVRRIFEAHGWDFRLRIVPEKLIPVYKSCFGEGLRIIEDRNNFDYVYDAEKLKTLSGRAYHAKKNHLNYFKNNYEYEYLPLSREFKAEVLAFEEDFVRHKVEDPDWKILLELEATTLPDIIDNMDAAGYFGGVIRIGGKIEAFCIAGPLNENTVTEHVEKANIEYRGLYQAINNEFCKRLPPEIQFLNREEDMGLENLRKSKLSLNPVRLEAKYTLILPPEG